MTPVAIGRNLRALRLRARLRQRDLGRRVSVSQSVVSGLERGLLGAASLATLGRLFDAVGGELILQVRWRGGEIDRLTDRLHARLVERTAERLEQAGWSVHPEVSFSRYGERGSIDLLAVDQAAAAAVVTEVKSAIYGVEDTLRRHDVKVRLAREVVHERFGFAPALVSKLLVVPATTTARRRVAEHAVTFRRAYPDRGVSLRRARGSRASGRRDHVRRRARCRCHERSLTGGRGAGAGARRSGQGWAAPEVVGRQRRAVASGQRHATPRRIHGASRPPHITPSRASDDGGSGPIRRTRSPGGPRHRREGGRTRPRGRPGRCAGRSGDRSAGALPGTPPRNGGSRWPRRPTHSSSR